MRLEVWFVLAAEDGLSKTRTALAIVEEAACERVLVVGPSIAAGVWRSEAWLTQFPLPIFLALDADLDVRADSLRSWMALHPKSMIITNYQSFWRPKLLPLLQRWQPDAVLMDEVQALRSRTSKQSKGAGRLALLPSVRCRLGLGRAITNGVQDLYGIYRFLDPTVFPRRWADFSDEFLTLGWFNQVTGSRNDEEIQRRLVRTSSQIKRADVWGGLPKRRDQDWPVVLTDESATRYRQFAREAVARIEGTDVDGNVVRGTVSADLVITQAMRLQQLVSGHTKLNDKIVDVSSEKVDAAVELAEQTIEGGEQVVLFCAFRREIARIATRLSQAYPGGVGVIQGGMRPEEQTREIALFQHGKRRALVIQIAAGSKSVELDAATVGIIVSTGYDLDCFEQAKERLTGTDPNRQFTYYYLKAELPTGKNVETIDARVYTVLMNKQQIAGRFSVAAAKQLLGVAE